MRLNWLLVAASLLACSTSPEETPSTGGTEPPPSTGGSQPLPLPRTAAQISASQADASSAASTIVLGRAYVSMLPGTEPGGDSATITHFSGGESVGTRMTDGGFDPVAIDAQTGDTLAISIHHATGPTTTAYGMVPMRGRPSVVRTSAASVTDVPLNYLITVVFSEPMDSISLTGALHLQLQGVEVPGAVTPVSVGGVILSGEFRPTSPLEPGTTYQISISTAARDLGGIPLSTPVQVSFTTTDTTPVPPDPPISDITIMAAPSSIGVGETALLHAWGNGGGMGRIYTRHPMVWSSTDPSVAAVVPITSGVGVNGITGVDYFAHLKGKVEGVATISAAADGITASITITVGKPATSITVSPATATINASLCEAVQLTALLRDGAGALLAGRRPIWSSSSSSVYVEPIEGVVFAGDSGTATITANTGLVQASAQITVIGHQPLTPGHKPLCDG